jgi:hypothetical protein
LYLVIAFSSVCISFEFSFFFTKWWLELWSVWQTQLCWIGDAATSEPTDHDLSRVGPGGS